MNGRCRGGELTDVDFVKSFLAQGVLDLLCQLAPHVFTAAMYGNAVKL